jgi:hypothetical protein
MTPLAYILLGAGLVVVLYCVGRGLDERGFNRGRRQGYKEGFLAGSQSRQNEAGYNMGYSHGRYMEAESWARMDAEVESEKLRLECEGEDAD